MKVVKTILCVIVGFWALIIGALHSVLKKIVTTLSDKAEEKEEPKKDIHQKRKAAKIIAEDGTVKYGDWVLVNEKEQIWSFQPW